jgi:uncharacterized membrane protein YfcA
MMISTLALVILGIAVGSFGTLVGIGGGVLLVPIFILFMHYSPQYAIGTSLAIVCLNALSGTFAYIRQQKVYYDAAVRFSLATIPGAFMGSYLAGYFTSKTFCIAFGLLLVMLAALMYYRANKKTDEIPFDKESFQYNRVLGIALSFVVGFLSSILGIGGGVIHVPILIYLLRFPTHVATATSHFILAVSTLFGVASHFALGNILVGPAVSIGIGVILGAQIGARASLKVKSYRIQMALALAMGGLGLRLVLG